MKSGPRPPDYSDFDEVVVRRLVSGHSPGEAVRAPEAGEAIRRLARRGYSDGQIAAHLGFARRSITRIRERLHIAPGVPVGTNQHTLTVEAPSRHR